MSCADCGESCSGRLCRTCEQIRGNERRHGVPADYDDAGGGEK